MNIAQTLTWLADFNHAFGIGVLVALALWIVLDIALFGDNPQRH